MYLIEQRNSKHNNREKLCLSINERRHSNDFGVSDPAFNYFLLNQGKNGKTSQEIGINNI